MIKLFQPKTGERKQDVKIEDTKKVSPGMLRIEKDFTALDLPANSTVEFPNGKEDKTNFIIKIKPISDSYWYGGEYPFSVEIPNEYPHEAPKLKCLKKIFHPNILGENVCLNILRPDWKPVFNINTVIIGLNSLFNEPNPNDPLNKDAGELMRTSLKDFQDTVKKTLKGTSYKGETYEKFL